jgi:RHS repeat-associated protein
MHHHNRLFGFTGRMFESPTQLHSNLNRWYDVKVGWWLSEDPIGFDAGREPRAILRESADEGDSTDWLRSPFRLLQR